MSEDGQRKAEAPSVLDRILGVATRITPTGREQVELAQARHRCRRTVVQRRPHEPRFGRPAAEQQAMRRREVPAARHANAQRGVGLVRPPHPPRSDRTLGREQGLHGVGRRQHDRPTAGGDGRPDLRRVRQRRRRARRQPGEHSEPVHTRTLVGATRPAGTPASE